MLPHLIVCNLRIGTGCRRCAIPSFTAPIGFEFRRKRRHLETEGQAACRAGGGPDRQPRFQTVAPYVGFDHMTDIALPFVCAFHEDTQRPDAWAGWPYPGTGLRQ